MQNSSGKHKHNMTLATISSTSRINDDDVCGGVTSTKGEKQHHHHARIRRSSVKDTADHKKTQKHSSIARTSGSMNEKSSSDPSSGRGASSKTGAASSSQADGTHYRKKSKSSMSNDIDTDKTPVSLGGSMDLIQKYRKHRTKSSFRPSALKRSNSNDHITDTDKKPLAHISTLIQDFQWALYDLGWECNDHPTIGGSSLSSRRRSNSSSSIGSCSSSSSGGSGVNSSSSGNKQKLFDERKLQIEKWANFVNESLTSQERNFHGVTETSRLTESASSLQFLAAAFRNVVSSNGNYDEFTLRSNQKQIVGDVLDFQEIISDNGASQCVIQLSESSYDHTFTRTDFVVCTIFGYHVGDNLNKYAKLHCGLDVFMSTLIAVRMLKNVLSLSQIAKLATIMEATIQTRIHTDVTLPSKDEDEQNNDPCDSRNIPESFEKLYCRLVECNRSYKLSMTDDTMVQAIQLGVDLRNRMNGWMVSPNAATIIDHIWKMLPEKNPSLYETASFTITDYRMALQVMTQEITSICDSENTSNSVGFWSFRNLPSSNEVDKWNQQSMTNVNIAKLYLQARWVSLVLVECFACLTGGGTSSVPATYFLGDIPTIRNTKPKRLGDEIIRTMSSSSGADRRRRDVDQIVYSLLTGNDPILQRNEHYDTWRAPIAAYIYKELGIDSIQDIMMKWFEKTSTTVGFLLLDQKLATSMLEMLPFQLVQTIGKEYGEFVMSRKTMTQRLLQEIDQKQTMYFV